MASLWDGRRERGLHGHVADNRTWQTTWDAAQRTGSRGIFIWESTDLINWVNERFVVVEDATAGMVWAPEAIWDPAKGSVLRFPRGCQLN